MKADGAERSQQSQMMENLNGMLRSMGLLLKVIEEQIENSMQEMDMLSFALLNDPQYGVKQWVSTGDIWSQLGGEVLPASHGSRAGMLLNI